MHKVSIVRYTTPLESLKKAIRMIGGLGDICGNSKVFIKPNFVVWFEDVNFPKYGALTTARMIEDVVLILNEHGVSDITLVEGMVKLDDSPKSFLKMAVEAMGLDILSKRFGLKFIDTHNGNFAKVDLGNVTLSVNSDIFDADYIIDMPVLKTHVQCKVSLGIKNLKGLLSISSRKICHNRDREKNLDYHVAKLAELLAPSLTIIDGIYSLEYGPTPFGEARRSDLIIASRDLISADKVGATLLGHSPNKVPHIALAAKSRGRPVNLSDIEIVGDIVLNNAIKTHEYASARSEADDIPLLYEAAGIKGIRLPKVDNTLCTYCAFLFCYVFMGILMSTNKDTPFDDIEILFGKTTEPSGKHKHTLLLGQCQVKMNRKNPLINDCIMIKGCPPKKVDFIKAFKELSIDLPENPTEWFDNLPEVLMRQYENKPRFEEKFFRI